jgi:hypothetical protein
LLFGTAGTMANIPLTNNVNVPANGQFHSVVDKSEKLIFLNTEKTFFGYF